MTDSARVGHPFTVSAAPGFEGVAPGRAGSSPAIPPAGPSILSTLPAERPSFDEVYEQCLDYVWRSVRTLGVRDPQLDDAVQDVFVVVHRRLGEFEARSSIKTWVFGIAVRVARDYRRREQRKGGLGVLDFDVLDQRPGPDAQVETSQALGRLAKVLDALDEDKREVFVLAEVEQLTSPEIAELLGIKLNTVYSRLRAARREFEIALAAQEGSDR
ncbi:MAG: sigma-70 family RNA polymerase sigma factor [Polyangiaceae bacterium]